MTRGSFVLVKRDERARRELGKPSADSVLARAVGALDRFPTDRSWVLIGGLAVFIRLGKSLDRPHEGQPLDRSDGVERVRASP